MFQQKIRPNRKKNLSSKIIVDQYDHLIKNSKLQPNYDSFLQPPLSPHFMHNKEQKFVPSKQQSSESEYSMHHLQQTQGQRQCEKCGQMFSLRIYDSHKKVCQKNVRYEKKFEEKIGFGKKDQYNLFQVNQSIDLQSKLLSARCKNGKKSSNPVTELNDTKKLIELKQSSSKKSITSQQKNVMKRPSSSTRNKVQLKGHQNLKQKILNKLEGTRKKPSEQPATKRISSSLNKKTTSNSRPKPISNHLNLEANNQKRFSTINSSSINKKKPEIKTNTSHVYDFSNNRSQIINQGQKQKSEFLSKANLKEEKKQTLKKKNIACNFNNNSFVVGDKGQKDKEKEMKSMKKMESMNFTENNSYAGQGQRRNNNYVQREKEFFRQQLKKQGPFRRQSSSASKRKVNVNSNNTKSQHHHESKRQPEQKPYRGMQEVNDQYYFFQNHPSSVPSYVLKRQQPQIQNYQKFDQYQDGQNYEPQNIIRNKLGINKQFMKQSKQSGQNYRNPQAKTQQQIRKEQQFMRSQLLERQGKRESQHRRSHSGRENQTQKNERFYQANRQYMNEEINNNDSERRGQEVRRANIQRNVRNNEASTNQQRNNTNGSSRPQNPMGHERMPKRQNINRQNRPEPRITNQRMNSQAQHQHQASQQAPIRPQARQNTRNQQSRRQQTNQRSQPAQSRQQGTQQRSNRQQNRRQQGNRRGTGQRIHHETLNFISNTLNQQFQVMNQHFNLLNNIFSNFSNIVNVNISTSGTGQNPTTFVFRQHGGRRRHRNHREGQSDDQSHSEYSDFSSEFSEDQSDENETDYDQDQYYYEDQQQDENPGMTEHQINSIPILRYNKQKLGSNQCTICLVELNQNQPFKKLYCDHVFHTQCIDEWLKRKNACPVCRDQMGVRH